MNILTKCGELMVGLGGKDTAILFTADPKMIKAIRKAALRRHMSITDFIHHCIEEKLLFIRAQEA